MSAAFLVIILSILTVAFGSLPGKGAVEEVKVIEIERESDRLSFDKLPTSIYAYIATFLENPFKSLPMVCTATKKATCEIKSMQLSLLKSRAKHPIFNQMEWSPEIHNLLKFNPVILNQFFDDFFVSDHGCKVMNKAIFEYAMPLKLRHEVDQDLSQMFFGLLSQFLKQNKFEFIERLLSIYEERGIDITFHHPYVSSSELFQYLYTKNRNIYKFLFKNQSYEFISNTISLLFNVKDLTVDDFMGFFDFVPIRARLNGLRISIIENEFELTCPEDKQIILSRNQRIISTLLQTSNDWTYLFELDLFNSARYSEMAEVNFSSTRIPYIPPFISFKVIDNVGRAALLGNNLDIFHSAFIYLKGRKFSRELYYKASKSRKIIESLSEEALLDFFDIPRESESYYNLFETVDYFNPIMRLEVISRIKPEFRTLEDLDRIFLTDEFAKLLALAFYYPLNHLIEKLFNMPNAIPNLLLMISPNSLLMISPMLKKIRNAANTEIEIVYQILKSMPNLRKDTPKLDKIVSAVFGFKRYISTAKMLAESENEHFISFICSNFQSYKSSESIYEIQMDPKFKRNLMRPQAQILISKILINLQDLERFKFLSHEIVEMIHLLGLEIGNFNFDFNLLTLDEESVTRFAKQISSKLIYNYKGVQIDQFIVILALNSFYRQRESFGTTFHGNLMLLNSFGLFQLWWERNLMTFEKFAPRDIVDAFQKRNESQI